MLQLKVSLKGFDELLGALERLDGGLRDMRPAMETVGAYFLAGIRKGFQDETSPVGLPWRGLSATTAAIREHQGYGPYHPILVRSGELHDSFNVAEVGPLSVAVGSSLGIAGYHQTGYQNGKSRVAARPMADFPPDAADRVPALILQHLHDSF